MVKKLIIFITAINLALPSYAGGFKDVGKLWNKSGKLNFASTNSPTYYKGQRAGHYTMGSMYFAREKKNRPLINVRFPEIDFDKSCYSQGVLNFGGMSFISGKELMSKLQGIVSQAGMMFVYNGISSISPVIGETLQEVYSKLQEVGGFLADECQAAKALNGMIGDVFTGHSSLAQSISSRFGQSKGEKSDLSSAYKDYPRGRKETLEKAAQKDESLILEDINLAWKALDKLGKDKDIKEFMMSVSGTIIIHAPKSDEQQPEFQYISPNITSPDMLKTLLKGGNDLPILKCGESKKCLHVLDDKKTIDRKESFEFKVTEYFEKFRAAIQADEEIAEGSDVHNFLSSSGLPVYKIYDVIYQYTHSNPEYEQGVFVEVVAWNILYNYLSDTLKEVTEAANNLKIAAGPQLKEFRESLLHAQKMLTDLEMKDLNRYKMQLFLVNRAENYEKSIAQEISKLYSMRSN
ncbi:MAG: conjugal transfer protein TraH [Rickettsiales bacterium]